jgi:hypothetical protein
MAEIDIQKKKGQPAWVWILGVVALLVVVGVIWAVTRDNDTHDDPGVRQDTVPAQTTGLPAGYDAPPIYLALSPAKYA